MATSQSAEPKYGEKGAQMRNYPQRHQAPKALQRAMGNDKMCMEMCPSPGLHLDKLGDRADPLPPERKKMYEKKKARIQAARAKAIRSQEGGIKSPRKTVAKRKPLAIENTTPPPEQPPPLMTVFTSAPPPPAPQLSASQSETSIHSCAQSPTLPRFTFSYSMPSVTLDSCYSKGTASTVPELRYQPPQTAKNIITENVLNAPSFEFYTGPQSRHASDLAPSHSPSRSSTPSLEWDRGTPATVESPRSSSSRTWIDGPTPTPQSPSTPEQLDCRLSVPQRDVDSEELFNEVYQSFFIPRSSWSRPSPTMALEHGHMNPQSVIPETPHKARNTVQHIPDRIDGPPPSQPATISHPDLRTRDLMPTTTTIWTSTPQGSHSQPRHLYVPATTPSGVVHDHQRRGPAGKGAAGATATPGVRRLERGTFGRQHAPPPYPSHFTRVAAGHTRLNHSLATPESSVAAQSAGCGTTPSIAGAVARQAQVRHHDGSAILDHAPHNNPHHLSMRTSPSHVHSVHANSVPLACTTPVPPVNSITQHQFGAPNTASTQRSQPTRTSKSAYSELAHALVDPHSIAPLVEQAGIGEGVGHGHLYSAQVGSGAIGSSRTSAPEPLAHWQIDLPVASHPILDHPLIGPGTSVMVAPSTSRAQATHDDDMARTLGGCFDECEPFGTNIMASLLGHGTEFATGQGFDETYLEASSAGFQSDVTQQLLTTPTCQEAQCRIHHPYPPSTGPSSTFNLRLHLSTHARGE